MDSGSYKSLHPVSVGCLLFQMDAKEDSRMKMIKEYWPLAVLGVIGVSLFAGAAALVLQSPSVL